MIPQETVNQILDAARIEEVIGDYVTLKRRGASLVACCPFHNEKTPSFYVTPSKGIYKCFGCGKAGSAVGFVMDYEHYSYAEALKYLAKKYHIEVKEEEEDAAVIAARQHNESLMLVSEFAEKFFVQQLKTDEGRNLALSYYHYRGLDDATIERFGLGWAPSGRTTLRDAALAAGYKLEYLLDAGLCVQGEDGKVYDKFRERVTFPIQSVSGRVIAYSCRTLKTDDKVAKYVNSPETEIYHKSNCLFGIWFAKAAMSRLHKCILVEGNLDVVSLHQLGLDNVVASCGTALTESQVRLISKFTDTVTIMYDGDSAGIHATLKAFEIILSEGLNVRAVLLPDGHDPDEYSREHTLEEFRSYIDSNEVDFITYAAKVCRPDKSDPISMSKFINDIADTIAVIPDAVTRTVYINSCAEKVGIDADPIRDRVTKRREAIREEKFKEREREKRRADNGLASRYIPATASAPATTVAPAMGPSAGPEPELTMASLEVNKIVAKAEEDILYLILSHGVDVLDFETDSVFYSGSEAEKPTVMDMFRDSFEADGLAFLNPAFKRTYDAYAQLYDEGYDGNTILRRLLDSPYRDIAFVASQLSMEKYELTVKSFADSLTTRSSWLVAQVPRTIMFYMERRIENDIVNCRRSIADAEASHDETALGEALKEYNRLLAGQRNLRFRISALSR